MTSRSPTSASSPSYACFITREPAVPCSKLQGSPLCSMTNSPRTTHDRRPTSNAYSHIPHSYRTSTWIRSKRAAPASISMRPAGLKLGQRFERARCVFPRRNRQRTLAGGFGQRIDPDPFDAALEQQLGCGGNDFIAIRSTHARDQAFSPVSAFVASIASLKDIAFRRRRYHASKNVYCHCHHRRTRCSGRSYPSYRIGPGWRWTWGRWTWGRWTWGRWTWGRWTWGRWWTRRWVWRWTRRWVWRRRLWWRWFCVRWIPRWCDWRFPRRGCWIPWGRVRWWLPWSRVWWRFPWS